MDLGYFETSLNVQDIKRSVKFYEALGFAHIDGGVEIRTVSMARGDCRIALYQGYLDPPQTQLIFWQGDIEALGRELVGKGLTLEKGPHKDDKGAALMFRDPDGHPIFLINMPIRYVNDPGYEHEMPAYRRARLKPDMQLGWFNLSLDVEDIGRSVEFYEKLGFKRLRDTAPRTATLHNGDCRICLYQGYLDPAQTQLIFWQGDLDAIAATVTRQGLSFFREPKSDETGEAFMLRDPDGHPLFFINLRKYRPAEAAA
ncbi:MAG TPA: VOC family protein [Caulobacteraceae bacterium]